MPRNNPLNPSTPSRGANELVNASPTAALDPSTQNPAIPTAVAPTACNHTPAENVLREKL